ncbi:MAG: hypothetical protein GYB33_08705 [Gammaproteobacteria bacterium]|nr:hypothetical protein [Gammaproteobacteria bacterium]
MKLMKLVAMFVMSLPFCAANAWNNDNGNGSLGFGTIEVCDAGEFEFSYSLKRGRPGSEMRQGVQMIILNWDDIYSETSYFKLRSEHFVASVVNEKSDEATLRSKLKPGKYAIIYGQWYGISHDNPNDPYFDLKVKDLKGRSNVSSIWAGDVSMLNPSRKPYIAGQWGAIGKISAFWDPAANTIFGIAKIFPGSKKVTHFGVSEYKYAGNVASQFACK